MIRLNKNNPNTPEYFSQHFDGRLATADMERAWALIKHFKSGKILDIGFWDSPMPMLLAERSNTEVWALDFAAANIEYFKPRFPKVNWIIHDIRNGLPFLNAEFDYVYAGEVIEHMEDPLKFVDELKRVVKPGGFVALSTPHREVEWPVKMGGPLHLWSFDESDMPNLFGCPVEIQTIKEGQFNTSMLAFYRKETK